ncbi:MAG: hypothetical protein CMJ81_00620 [Planctomycetaceae bacterium]|nr:hypothetical protein [Planctomycetaceae bacterium]
MNPEPSAVHLVQAIKTAPASQATPWNWRSGPQRIRCLFQYFQPLHRRKLRFEIWSRERSLGELEPGLLFCFSANSIGLKPVDLPVNSW